MSEQGVHILGDIVEIGMAALKGDEDARCVGVEADPDRFQTLCSVCQQIQLLDGI